MKPTLKTTALVFAGGAMGTWLRWAIGQGTAWFVDAPEVWLIVAALTGGISTFSSVAANTWQFISLKLRARAFLNLLLNFALPYMAAIAGLSADLLIR
ncbi:MAG: hypothetical protein RLZZ359_963 [Actinomycetota bacterium]